MSTTQKNNAKKPSTKGNGKQKSRIPAREQSRQKQQRQVSIAAAYSTPLKTLNLKQTVNKDGSRSLRWREFVQDINGSVAFSVTSFPVQPGIPTLFAWLANQALFFQEYEFRVLKFDYETEKGSSTNGKVMFAFQQDVADAVPLSKQEMLENMYKAAGAPWEPFSLRVPMGALGALGKTRFVRSGTLASNLDQKTYDVGQLLVATQGMADATAVGELYVEYEIVLKTPLQNNNQLAQIFSKRFTGAVSVSQTAFLGTTPTTVGGLDVTGTGATFTFNRVGQYLIDFWITGTGLFTAFQPTLGGTAPTTSVLNGISNAAANVGTEGSCSIAVTILARGQTVIIDWTADATTITASTTRVSMYAVA